MMSLMLAYPFRGESIGLCYDVYVVLAVLLCVML